MKSTPILFSSPMIKALLREQDPKLMTRRTRDRIAQEEARLQLLTGEPEKTQEVATNGG